MSRPIDADILTKLESKQFRPFYLLHMDIDSVDYRYTDCDVPIVHDTNVYTHRGFRFQSATYSAGRIVDQVQIEIDNLDSVMTSVFVDGTPQDEDVLLMMVVVDDDGTLVEDTDPEIIIFDGQIDSWVLDEEKLKVTVTSALSKWSQKTLSKHPKSCRWKVFKGTECQYAGGETWCDRTYARCIALSNTANYGGFRFLPSLVDKAIWWGSNPNF